MLWLSREERELDLKCDFPFEEQEEEGTGGGFPAPPAMTRTVRKPRYLQASDFTVSSPNEFNKSWTGGHGT